jgi:hypothetical protein
MDNMEKLTHPIELSGEELDLVAAGCGGHQGESTTQVGLVNINDVNVGVNVLGFQSQRT